MVISGCVKTRIAVFACFRIMRFLSPLYGNGVKNDSIISCFTGNNYLFRLFFLSLGVSFVLSLPSSLPPPLLS